MRPELVYIKNLANVSFKKLDTDSFSLNITVPLLLTEKLLSLLQKEKDSLVLNIRSGAGTGPHEAEVRTKPPNFSLALGSSLAEEFEGNSPRFCLTSRLAALLLILVV